MNAKSAYHDKAFEIIHDVQLVDLTYRDAQFVRAELADAIAQAIATAVQNEREAILSKANDLEFSPAKWSDLLEFISGDMFPTKAQA